MYAATNLSRRGLGRTARMQRRLQLRGLGCAGACKCKGLGDDSTDIGLDPIDIPIDIPIDNTPVLTDTIPLLPSINSITDNGVTTQIVTGPDGTNYAVTQDRYGNTVSNPVDTGSSGSFSLQTVASVASSGVSNLLKSIFGGSSAATPKTGTTLTAAQQAAQQSQMTSLVYLGVFGLLGVGAFMAITRN